MAGLTRLLGTFLIRHLFNNLNQSTNRTLNQSTNQPINQSTNQSINKSIDHSINSLKLVQLQNIYFLSLFNEPINYAITKDYIDHSDQLIIKLP